MVDCVKDKDKCRGYMMALGRRELRVEFMVHQDTTQEIAKNMQSGRSLYVINYREHIGIISSVCISEVEVLLQTSVLATARVCNITTTQTEPECSSILDTEEEGVCAR